MGRGTADQQVMSLRRPEATPGVQPFALRTGRTCRATAGRDGAARRPARCPAPGAHMVLLPCRGLTPGAGSWPESAMFEPASQDQVVVQFAGADAGTEPLAWGQKAILQDMQASGGQFSMG